MSWYAHQQAVIDEDPLVKGLGFGCGAGKTRTVLALADARVRAGARSVLVLGKKSTVSARTWPREMAKVGMDLPLTVMSKEEFKARPPGAHDVLVVDECHAFCGVTPFTRHANKVEVPKASQLFEATRAWVVEHRPKAIYMASATPFPSPMALWGAAAIMGEDWDFFAFRRKFYHYVPTIGRGVWMPKQDAEHVALLTVLAQKLFVFGRLQDFFDVPEQTFKDIDVGATAEQARALKKLPLLYPDPMVLVGKEHKLEQGILEGGLVAEAKADKVVELGREFEKTLVFARYTAQVDMLAARLREEFPRRDVLVMDGRTSAADRTALLAAAEERDRGTFVVAQSQVSDSYELPSFRCTVFASLTYSFVDYDQAIGRTLRSDRLEKNLLAFLTAGPVDEAVLECVRQKRDFNEGLYVRGRSA